MELNSEIYMDLSELKDSVKKLLPDDMDELIDDFSELSTGFKFCKLVWTKCNELKFKNFLRTFQINCKTDELSRQKINVYLENPKNLIIIADIIDNAINSKSIRCSAILGYYAGYILNEQKTPEYLDRLVINALRELYDEDLDIFCEFYEFSQLNPEKFNAQIKGQCSVRISDLMSKFDNPSFTLSDAEISFEKLKNVYLVGYDIGGVGGLGNSWGSFKFNQYSDYFYEIIKCQNNQRKI